jgi:hypothetical protein
MSKRLVCVALTLAVWCAFAGTRTLAATGDETLITKDQRNQSLKASINKALDEARTSKRPNAPYQTQPAQSNGLSKANKIVLVVGVAVVIVAIIVIVHEVRDFHINGITVR